MSEWCNAQSHRYTGKEGSGSSFASHMSNAMEKWYLRQNENYSTSVPTNRKWVYGPHHLLAYIAALG